MKKRQDAIKQDEQDLDNLQEYVGKVQKLRKQFIGQKSEIDSLNGIISDLKSQNQELRSNSVHKTQSNKDEDEEEWHKGKKSRNGIDANNLTDHQQFRQTKVKGNIVKVLKQDNILDEKTNQSSFYSIKNHSGFMTQYGGRYRMASPQPNYRRFNQSCHYNIPTMDSVHDFRINYIHNETKKKVVENLVEDLRDQLHRKQIQCQEEHEKYVETKKQLKKKNKECKKLQEMNGEILQQYDILERQNKLMKEQIAIQAEEKIQLEEKVKELMYILKQKEFQEEKQFKKMDVIYSEFEGMLDFYRK